MTEVRYVRHRLLERRDDASVSFFGGKHVSCELREASCERELSRSPLIGFLIDFVGVGLGRLSFCRVAWLRLPTLGLGHALEGWDPGFQRAFNGFVDFRDGDACGAKLGVVEDTIGSWRQGCH